MPKRKLTGTIISNKTQKTVVVEVERIKAHPKYKRRFKIHKKYKAHIEGENYNVGDKVIIEECRPISKDKHWRVIKKIISAPKEEKTEEFLEEEVLSEGEDENKKEENNQNPDIKDEDKENE